MVLDAIEGDLATKSDLFIFKQQIENRMNQFEQRIESRLTQSEERTERRFIEYEFRILTRMGIMMASMISIAVAVLTWLIKT